MKNAAMRFRGYEMSHNPEKLSIKTEAKMMDISSSCTSPDCKRLYTGLRTISGEGELFGSDCLEQFRELNELFMSGEKGSLTLPGMAPMTAYMRSLELIAEPVDDTVGYKFGFIEACGEHESNTPSGHYSVGIEGESLWDIAYRFDKTIDELVELNPHIRYNDERG